MLFFLRRESSTGRLPIPDGPTLSMDSWSQSTLVSDVDPLARAICSIEFVKGFGKRPPLFDSRLHTVQRFEVRELLPALHPLDHERFETARLTRARGHKVFEGVHRLDTVQP